MFIWSTLYNSTVKKTYTHGLLAEAEDEKNICCDLKRIRESNANLFFFFTFDPQGSLKKERKKILKHKHEN